MYILKAMDRGSKDQHYPATVDEMVRLRHIPVVAIDEQGLFTFLNEAFTEAYGWSRQDLAGKSVTEIMPAHMRSAHTVGFARFLTTETARLLGKPLPLAVRYKDGRELPAVHYIIGDKQNGVWRFAAIIERPAADA